MINDFNIGVHELKQGYTQADDSFQCLFCNQQYFSGDIYAFGSRLVDARTAAKLHVQETHGSVFDALIARGKKATGLSQVQSDILSCFYKGIPDKEIAQATNTAPSTIRYQRFHLREKARQAKAFLALFELMEAQAKYEPKSEIHRGATMVDQRYLVTEEEAQKIIDSFFTSTDPLVLKTFSSKEKKKLVILRTIARQFEKDIQYPEKEVNRILKSIYPDYATLRRYLIEYGFLDRTPNCESYWVK